LRGGTVAELISLVVTTYNWPEALAAVLRSLSRQTDQDFEVIVADDGSGPTTGRLVADWVARMPVPLKHVWHKDSGFRAAEIRNRAARMADGAYCIFLDGDCLARPDFVAVHRRLAETGWFVAGNRILLTQALTQTILRDNLQPETWTWADLLRQRLSGGINRAMPAFALPLGSLRRLKRTAWTGVRSCNLAIWRSDFERVDGFDAAFNGWGLEDSDLVVRLLHAGASRKDGRFATGVLHLWHVEVDRSRFADNQRQLEAVLACKRTRAQRGVSWLVEQEGSGGLDRLSDLSVPSEGRHDG
jgi:glycosyltransferase involved in cell wall biosynthesis